MYNPAYSVDELSFVNGTGSLVLHCLFDLRESIIIQLDKVVITGQLSPRASAGQWSGTVHMYTVYIHVCNVCIRIFLFDIQYYCDSILLLY